VIIRRVYIIYIYIYNVLLFKRKIRLGGGYLRTSVRFYASLIIIAGNKSQFKKKDGDKIKREETICLACYRT